MAGWQIWCCFCRVFLIHSSRKRRSEVLFPQPNRVLLHAYLCQHLHYQPLSTPLHPPVRNPHQSSKNIFPQSSPHCSLMAQLRTWLVPVSLSIHLLFHLLLHHQCLRHPFPRRARQTAQHLLLPQGLTALSSPPPAPLGCVSWSHLLSSCLLPQKQGSHPLHLPSSLMFHPPPSPPQGVPTPPKSSHPPAQGDHHRLCRMFSPSISQVSQPTL